MAIGKTGSFATTATPQVDFGGMIRRAQEKEDQYQQRKIAISGAYERMKDTMIGAIPDYEITDDVQGKSAVMAKTTLSNMMRDEVYKIQKSIEEGNIKDGMSRAEMKAKVAELTNKIGTVKQNFDVITNPDNNFYTNLDKHSDGLSDSYYNMMESLGKGKVEKIELNENNVPVIVYEQEGQKVKRSLSALATEYQNFPQRIDYDTKNKQFADEFKPPSIKTPDGRYTDVSVEEMSPSQKEEVKLYYEGLASEPNKLNHVVYTVTGLKDIRTLEQLDQLGLMDEETGESLSYEDLVDEYANMQVQSVENRMTSKKETEVDRVTRRLENEYWRDKRDEGEKDKPKVYGVSQVSTPALNVYNTTGDVQPFRTTKLDATLRTPVSLLRGDEGDDSLVINEGSTIKEIGIDNEGNMVVSGVNVLTDETVKDIEQNFVELSKKSGNLSENMDDLQAYKKELDDRNMAEGDKNYAISMYINELVSSRKFVEGLDGEQIEEIETLKQKIPQTQGVFAGRVTTADQENLLRIIGKTRKELEESVGYNQSNQSQVNLSSKARKL